MQGNIHLMITGKKTSLTFVDFTSYRVTSNLFEAADAFELVLVPVNGVSDIEEGSRCRLYVNDQLELVGIIDSISESYSKADGRQVTLKGRDLMGILVDSYVEDFEGRQNESLEDLAMRLLANVDFVDLKKIRFGKESKARGAILTETPEDYDFTEVAPGNTIFEVLRGYAVARGLLFFAMPDGTFVFDKPVDSGAAEFTLICKDARPSRPSYSGNNILQGGRVRDISKRFKKVTVMGQRQANETDSAEDINIIESIEDETFPFNKTFVANVDFDSKDPKQYARILMEKQQFSSYFLQYKTFGHSQNGRIYQINSVCHVEDEIFNIQGDFLIYGRTFEMSKADGHTTTLQLSKLGIRPV